MYKLKDYYYPNQLYISPLDCLQLQLRVSSQFLSRPDNLGDFTFVKQIQGDKPQQVTVDRSDFQNQDGKLLEWSKVATLTISIVDLETRQKVDLVSRQGEPVLQRIALVE